MAAVRPSHCVRSGAARCSAPWHATGRLLGRQAPKARETLGRATSSGVPPALGPHAPRGPRLLGRGGRRGGRGARGSGSRFGVAAGWRKISIPPYTSPDAAAARPPPAGPAARPARRPAPPAWRAPRQGPGQGQGPLRRRWCQGLSSRRGRAHPFRPPASARAARHSLGCQVLRRRARGGGQAEMRLRMRQRLVAGGWRMRAGGPPAAAVPAPAERRARLW